MSGPLNQIGDKVFLGSWQGTIHAYGVISDLDTPDMTAFSIEGQGPNAIMSTAALVGPQGPAGNNAPAAKLQFPFFDSTDDLPTNLTDDPVDIGKYWVVKVFDDDANEIGSVWNIWDGTAFQQFQMGSPGPAGPVPAVSVSVVLIDPEETSHVVKTGSDFSPTFTFYIAAPEGPVGPAGPIRDSVDYDDTVAPVLNDVIAWNGTKYAPKTADNWVPEFFTYPEGHFTSVSLAIGTRVPIGTALIPPIDHDVVPYVQGHFRLTGIEADTTPFIIGVEVRLGNATSGQVVARGYGNITGYVNLVPHASTHSTPNDAITPGNGRGLIPANTSGASATLYVNAFNDGAAGLYSFDATGAQLSVLAIPVTPDGS